MKNFWPSIHMTFRHQGRKKDAVQALPKPTGSFANMYTDDGSKRIGELMNQGWVEAQIKNLESTYDFLQMKEWCETHAGALGEKWINISLSSFLFRDSKIAVMFKLTFV